MKEDRTGKRFRDGLRSLRINLADEAAAVDRLLCYFNELKKWNRKINLVSREAGDAELIDRHFLDSLLLLHCLDRHPETALPDTNYLLDIGTGAGFPGLALKVAVPALAVTLVEPREKRCFFLKHVIRTIGLAGVEVITIRLAKDSPHPLLAGRRFSWATSRAVTDIGSILAMAAPYMKEDGRIVCMKGPTGREELAREMAEGPAAAVSLLETKEYRLPFSGAQRTLFVLGNKRLCLTGS